MSWGGQGRENTGADAAGETKKGLRRYEAVLSFT